MLLDPVLEESKKNIFNVFSLSACMNRACTCSLKFLYIVITYMIYIIPTSRRYEILMIFRKVTCENGYMWTLFFHICSDKHGHMISFSHSPKNDTIQTSFVKRILQENLLPSNMLSDRFKNMPIEFYTRSSFSSFFFIKKNATK